MVIRLGSMGLRDFGRRPMGVVIRLGSMGLPQGCIFGHTFNTLCVNDGCIPSKCLN